MSEDRSLAHGFRLALPEGWEVVEAPPARGRIAMSDDPPCLPGAYWRLGRLEDATGGTHRRASFAGALAGAGAEAELVVAIYATDVGGDLDSMKRALSRLPGAVDRVAPVEPRRRYAHRP